MPVPNTRLYGHWLADVHLAGFTPAFTLSFHDSECSRKPPNAHSLGRSNKENFIRLLKSHQKGETDYFTYCKHCAETGIGNWLIDLKKMTCTYYDKAGNEILVENIPAV